MSAAPDSNAILVRLLPHAEHSHRPATGALAVDSRPVGGRSVAAAADHYGRQHVRVAEDDAAGRHGPCPAAHDEHYDAGDDGHLLLQIACGAELVLRAQQPNHDSSDVDHEPDRAWPRNARYGGEAGEKER